MEQLAKDGQLFLKMWRSNQNPGLHVQHKKMDKSIHRPGVPLRARTNNNLLLWAPGSLVPRAW